ncbi:MAG: hypothetical protein IPJ65_03315 [Archangiaceae bacterium]|nr:hypothetical protein [Archangiaceae bacterium]
MKCIALLSLFFAACAFEPVLVPDETAQTLSPRVAVTQNQQVQVAINGQAWKSNPFDLAEVLTPLHVSLDNVGTAPLRVAYRDFTLKGDTGMRYTAISPLQAQMPVGAVETAQPTRVDYRRGRQPARVTPRFHQRGYYIAPHYGPYYPGYATWGFPFPYSDYGTYAWPQQLPTEDMISEALPEGVLEAGGHVDGFIYFQGVPSREEKVEFDLRLVNGETGVALGAATIPMRVRLR